MTKFFMTMLLAAFLVSCDALLDLMDDDSDSVLEPDQFYAVNFTNNSFYKVRAKILYEGDKCVIWAENGSGITPEKAREIANKYETEIRRKIVGEFGMKNFTAEGQKFDDILDFANWLVGKDNKKLTVLLLDIKDNFKTDTDPYTAGYFYSGNFLKRDNKDKRSTSNGCDMIYVDTYPSLSSKYPQLEQEVYSTFAHELQHLINFATTVLKRDSPMDTWIDEGLSSQAEQIYFDANIKDNCTRFNKSKTIAKGNNFFVWGNHTEDKNAILDEYSTVYLFFRWLYLQADNNLRSSIFLDIETSNLSDYRVITNVANKIRPGKWNNWETLLSSWLAANYYPANTDYGYKDDFFYSGDYKIKVDPIQTTNNKISLAPGEGVYSRTNGSFTTPPSSGNIRYAGLPGSSSGIVQGSFNSGVLLTFNANTNNKAATETGSLTGVAASISSSTPNSRTAAEDAQTPVGPYRIDARDLSEILGRNK